MLRAALPHRMCSSLMGQDGGRQRAHQKLEGPDSSVEDHHSDLARRTSTETLHLIVSMINSKTLNY